MARAMKNNRTHHDLIPERNERDKVIDNIRYLYEQKCLYELEREEKESMQKVETGLLLVMLGAAVTLLTVLTYFVYSRI